MRVTCKYCGGPHPAYECRKKESTAARKDVPTRKGGYQATPSDSFDVRVEKPQAGTQALPVYTNAGSPSQVRPRPHKTAAVGSNPTPATNAGSSNGRTAEFDSANAGSTPAPASKFDKKAWMRNYMKQYMRDRRAEKKAGIR